MFVFNFRSYAESLGNTCFYLFTWICQNRKESKQFRSTNVLKWVDAHDPFMAGQPSSWSRELIQFHKHTQALLVKDSKVCTFEPELRVGTFIFIFCNVCASFRCPSSCCIYSSPNNVSNFQNTVSSQSAWWHLKLVCPWELSLCILRVRRICMAFLLTLIYYIFLFPFRENVP